MPYKRKGSPYWWVNLKGPQGQRIRQSTGTTNKQEAEAIEGRMKAELWQRQAWGKEPEYSFEDVIAEYLKAQRGSRSFAGTQISARILLEYFSGKTISSIKKSDVRWAMQDMQEKRSYKPSSVSTRMSTFKAAISFCRKELDWKIEDPSQGLHVPRIEKRVRWITEKQAHDLVDAASRLSIGYVLADFIELALNTGMRKNEMLKLQWRSVDLKNRLIVLLADENKSKRTRSIPLNDSALAVIERRRAFSKKNCPESPWVIAKRDGSRLVSPHNAFKEACRIAKIDDFRIHDLRHTCASWLVSAGVPLADVKEVLGHASITMTERYAHLAPHRAIDAVSKIAWSQSGHTKNSNDNVIRLKARRSKAFS